MSTDQHATLTSAAEAKIQAIIDSKDLYCATSSHEKTLLRLVRNLSHYVADKEPTVTVGRDVFWPTFRQWVLDNRALAESHACSFMSKFIQTKGNQKSVGHTIGLYVSIFKTWNVSLTPVILGQIKTLSRDFERNKKVRKCETDKVKSVQFERISSNWPAMVKYMSTVDLDEFRIQLKDVAVKCMQETDGYTGISSAVVNDMKTVAGKPNAELQALLVDTLSYASILRNTGMRSITGIILTKNAFEETDDGGVLLKRMERKCGNSRNVFKEVHVKIVPDKDPIMCTLLHLAAHIKHKDDDTPLFTAGIAYKTQGRDSFAKMVQRRYVGVLHTVCFALGIPNGLGDSGRGEKLLHCFRVMCENVLAGRGASEQSRSTHVGWSSTVQSQHYSAKKYVAKHAVTPFLIAGRDSKDDEPAPLWHFIDKIPGGDEIDYWGRVRYIQAAHNGEPHVDPVFAAEMAKYCKDTTRHRLKTDIRFVAKRMRDAEEENRQLRAKVAKMELAMAAKEGTDEDSETSSVSSSSSSSASPAPPPVEQLRNLVLKLKGLNKEPQFPATCASYLPEITRLIDAGAKGKLTFGLPTNESSGKDLTFFVVVCRAPPTWVEER